MSRKLLSTCALVAAVAAVSANHAQAQASSNITASATVAAALSATTIQQLAFGTVIPGFNKTVLTNNATAAGIVRFTGAASAEVNVTLPTLPANLSDGTNNLPISYVSAHATSQAGAQTSFTPASGTTTLLDATTGFLFVFVGGTVTPGGAQVAGAYSGTITVQAAYTGN
jgi:hypothetical protein